MTQTTTLTNEEWKELYAAMTGVLQRFPPDRQNKILIDGVAPMLGMFLANTPPGLFYQLGLAMLSDIYNAYEYAREKVDEGQDNADAEPSNDAGGDQVLAGGDPVPGE